MRTMKAAVAALAPVVLGAALVAPGGAVAAGKQGAPERAPRAGAAAFRNFILQTGTALHETDDTFATATADWDR
ncbi:hypothetical protein LE181_24020, partial [Streptomyces sp. SCA3-4]|nr:hypothetical protein [Streptomyces sichuanensis]